MNRQKDRGTKYETSVVRYLRAELGDDRPERMALHGGGDVGDIGHIYCHGFRGIAECKAHKEVTPRRVEDWKRQTIDERDNADADFALLVVNQYNKGISQSLVYVTLRDLAKIALPMRLNEGWEDMADDHWVCMTLAECCSLMRGFVE